MPALSLWRREVVRFYRNISRVVGVVASPLIFWIVIGAGFGNSFRNRGHGQQLSRLLLSRRADDDRAVHLDLRHDVAD